MTVPPRRCFAIVEMVVVVVVGTVSSQLEIESTRDKDEDVGGGVFGECIEESIAF